MGFAEALSDDGKLSGRGAPWIRGAVCGLMTTLGGLGHTMPYLIRDFHFATTIALVVVAAELAVIAWIRKRPMHAFGGAREVHGWKVSVNGPEMEEPCLAA